MLIPIKRRTRELLMNLAIFTIGLLVSILALPIHAAAMPAEISPAASLMPQPKSMTVTTAQLKLGDNIKWASVGLSAQQQQALTLKLTKQLSSALQRPVQLTLVAKDQAQLLITQQTSQAHRPVKLGDDESYTLNINQQQIQISAANELGLNHGLSTLSQWLYPQRNLMTIQGVQIEDAPRYPWRGLLIDSARHFMPIDTIKRQIDGMASAKLNVLHWHLTDDQGWRFESKHYPKLTQLAADGEFYSQQQLQEIVAYAAAHGIRVVPEMDVPGHASAIAVAYPELMSQPGPYEMERHWGVFEPILDPTNPDVYQFVDKLVAELAAIFPDPYLHIGGDEVPPTQWLNNPNIVAFMHDNDFEDGEDLHAYFNQRISKILAKHQRKMMGWDEVFHPQLPKDTLVQSWRGMDSLAKITAAGHPGLLSTGFYIDQPQYSSYHYRNELTPRTPFAMPKFAPQQQAQYWQLTIPRLKGSAVSVGLLITADSLSAYVRLNDKFSRQVSISQQGTNVAFTLDTWMGPVAFELDLADHQNATGFAFIGNSYYPISGQLTAAKDANQLAQDKLHLAPATHPLSLTNTLGGEATIWAELITANNIDVRIWPRLYVIAERFWSAKDQTDEADMYRRLADMEHYGAEVIGLQHQAQQQAGWQALLGEKSTPADAQPLHILAQALEPAHYYTRHHINYQRDLYHQQAPLDHFVDYLAVESLPLIAIEQQLQQADAPLKPALAAMEQLLLQWQANQQPLLTLIAEHPRLGDINEVANQMSQVTDIGLRLTSQCQHPPLSSPQADAIDMQLLQLLQQQEPHVIAAAHTLRRLVSYCR